MIPEIYTVEEVAGLLKLKPRKVLELICGGRMRAVRISARELRVLKQDLDAFLSANRLDWAGTQAGPAPAAAKPRARPASGACGGDGKSRLKLRR